VACAPLLLNLGSGPALAPGWIAVDASWNGWLATRPWLRAAARAAGLVSAHHAAIPWPSAGILCIDASRGLPFPDGTVDGIFAAHLVEHLHPDDARRLLAECWRALAPGAALRVIVPDLEAIVDAYRRLLAQPGDHRAAAASWFLARLNLRGFGSGPSPRGWAWRIASSLSYSGHRTLFDRYSLQAAMASAGFESISLTGLMESRIPHIERVERPEHHELSVCVEGSRSPPSHWSGRPV
jgi:SAM-dependent methyltransferase